MTSPAQPSQGSSSHPRRLILHTGKPTANKVMAGCALALLVPLALVAVLLLGAMLNSSLDALAVVLMVFLGLLMVLAVFLIVGLVREKAWLEGTTVVSRGFFRTQRCDLAAATQFAFSARLMQPSYRMPLLKASNPRNRESVELWLHDLKTFSLLGPEKLVALADAIDRGEAARVEPFATQARQVSQGLRDVAANPLRNLF